MTLVINEAPCAPTVAPDTRVYQVRAFFNASDAGQVFGPVTGLAQAEQLLTVLAARDGVLRAVIETV